MWRPFVNDHFIFYSIQLPFSVQPLSSPAVTTSSMPTHITCSPPNRRRLWLHYALAVVGSVDSIPSINGEGDSMVEGPFLKGEEFLFGEDITRLELSNVLFDLQSLLYTSCYTMVSYMYCVHMCHVCACLCMFVHVCACLCMFVHVCVHSLILVD